MLYCRTHIPAGLPFITCRSPCSSMLVSYAPPQLPWDVPILYISIQLKYILETFGEFYCTVFHRFYRGWQGFIYEPLFRYRPTMVLRGSIRRYYGYVFHFEHKPSFSRSETTCFLLVSVKTFILPPVRSSASSFITLMRRLAAKPLQNHWVVGGVILTAPVPIPCRWNYRQ